MTSRFLAALALTLTIGSTGAQAATHCESRPDFTLASDGWGNGIANTRFQANSRIDRSNVTSLEVRWAFALDESHSPHSYPVITSDTLFIGTTDGNLYALDRFTGCIRWSFHAGEPIRSGLSYGKVGEDGRDLLFAGTFQGNVLAVDGATGRLAWKADLKDHPFVMVTGTPTFHEGRLYVGLSSGEVALAMNPFYGCCTFRGSLAALHAGTGATLWHTHVIDQQPEIVGRHWLFVEEWGPSGAPIWSAPTVDAGRGLVYAGTGENYTHPTTSRSDAIVAFDMATGKIVWSQQYTTLDAFNMACSLPFFNANCPDASGPDLDFGAPPIITRTAAGEPILVAGQKSGGVYGLDPATGERRWETRFGRGGMLGGVHWGMAVNERLGLVYAPVSDVPAGARGDAEAQPGLHAVDLATGEPRWSTPATGNCDGREQCRTGLSAAILATGELVFAAGLDGSLNAYDAATGDIVWTYDTWREYEAVNGLPARGGAIDVHGPAVAGRWLYVQSGYGSFGQRGGNVLLAFRSAGEAGPEASPDDDSPVEDDQVAVAGSDL